MDLVTCHCRNRRCAQCGKMGNASALQPHGSDRGEVRLRCTACGDVVSARTGTAYAGIRTDLGGVLSGQRDIVAPKFWVGFELECAWGLLSCDRG